METFQSGFILMNLVAFFTLL